MARQLYEAGLRPAMKYMAGRLSWVCLTVNRHTFILKTQRIVDYAIEGNLTVDGVCVFNRTQDAKTDFHYQLFRPERRRYYSELDVHILNEC